MKAYLLIDLIIFVNIYCCVVWAQTLNNETTTQLPGNTEPLVLEMTQTPKTGDNQTEYESITTTPPTNDLNTNIWNQIDLVSMNSTLIMTTITEKAIEVTESNTQAMESQTIAPTHQTYSPIDTENQTIVIDSGNSSSKSIETNEGEAQHTAQQTSESVTTHTSVLNTNTINEANYSRVTPQPLTTNITSISNELLENSSRSLNLSDYNNDETNDSSNSIPDVNTETIAKTSNITTEETNSSSTESSAVIGLSGDKTTTIQNSTQNSQNMSSTPEMTKTTQFDEINSRQTIETSTHKSSADTTRGIQTTTINAYIESSSRPKNEESAQITEIPIKWSENQTVSNHYYISEMSGNPIIDQMPQNQNQTQYPEIAQNSNLNASETSSTASVESAIHSQIPEVHRVPKLSTISTSLETKKLTNSMEMMPTNEQKQRETTETIPQTETEKPITTTTVSASTHSVRQTSGSQRQSKSEPMETETKPLIELLQTSGSTVSQPKQTTQILSQSTLTLRSTEATVSEKQTVSPTQQSQSSKVQTESQMTVSSIGVLASNDSEPSIDSETTFKQPLTDHSLKSTQYIKPMTTSIPLESNISAITVTLPNIKYISSISKEDMVNIVTITFVAKSIDIFRWVSIYDKMFRNFTCDRIDSERNWCSIDRFVYLSPSPLVVDNHLIVNFLVDDSTDNDLNTFHVFAGPLIVEALKNSTNSLETMMAMKVMSLQTNLGTMVVKPLENSPERLAKFELLVFIFTVVMFICTALLCLAVICSCAKRKSVDMNQIQLSNAGRRHTTTNGGFDLNSASNILRDENQENKLNHNVINLDGWVAPIDQVDSEKITKYDNLQDTKL